MICCPLSTTDNKSAPAPGAGTAPRESNERPQPAPFLDTVASDSFRRPVRWSVGNASQIRPGDNNTPSDRMLIAAQPLAKSHFGVLTVDSDNSA